MAIDRKVDVARQRQAPELGTRLGYFGRLFPHLPCLSVSADLLLRFGEAAGPLQCPYDPRNGDTDNPRIPAGWPFFGQLIAHDIIHDRAPLQDRQDNADLQNFRSPRLDLECVYGAGPVGQPYLYQLEDPEKFLVGSSDSAIGDLPRNQQGMALVGDARNDTHLFISQLHLAFLHFHNHMVDHLRSEGVGPEAAFDRARQLVRWHYQWIILHEFLPLNIGEAQVQKLVKGEFKICTFQQHPFVPLEFSAAAYRFGHAQIRAEYDVNAAMPAVPMFPDLVGICPVTSAHRVDWTRLFQFSENAPPLPSRRIGPQLVEALMCLPVELVGHPEHSEFSSLACRDLYRGQVVRLPSGQAIARAMGLKVCTEAELRLSNLGWLGDTPLWLYVLAEAEVQQNGELLGEVGGTIVGEVLVELLKNDPTAYLSSEPDWEPQFANGRRQFGIADLLRYAGVA